VACEWGYTASETHFGLGELGLGVNPVTSKNIASTRDNTTRLFFSHHLSAASSNADII
jgi:hypothetical protein